MVSRLRGTGRGVHFRDLVAALERDHPLTLQSPFEGSELVAGAAWEGPSLIGSGCTAALAKLRWSPGADDLPMHVHDHSDRFIIVDKGRGYFHVSDQPIERFDGSDVRSVPARERDVFVFTRGVVHTFSTAEEPMTLLSCQLPFLPFEDPHQYRLPQIRWTARENPESTPARVALDPSWMLLLGPVGF
jgi:mannose-6-phosphate isomerase-like protein (cupin superfamily)